MSSDQEVIVAIIIGVIALVLLVKFWRVLVGLVAIGAVGVVALCVLYPSDCPFNGRSGNPPPYPGPYPPPDSQTPPYEAPGPDLTFAGSVRVENMIVGEPIRVNQMLNVWMGVKNIGEVRSGRWAVRIKVRDQNEDYPDRVYYQTRLLGPGEEEGPVTTGSINSRTGAMQIPIIQINQPGSFQVTVIIETQSDVNQGNNVSRASFTAY